MVSRLRIGTVETDVHVMIDELEPVQRGVYTGAIGYWDVSGDCDWNIAIRTIITRGGTASFHAGGGIVADSTPEAEYEETLVKARGMMLALGVGPNEQGRGREPASPKISKSALTP